MARQGLAGHGVTSRLLFLRPAGTLDPAVADLPSRHPETAVVRRDKEGRRGEGAAAHVR